MTDDRFPVGALFNTPLGVLRITGHPQPDLTTDEPLRFDYIARKADGSKHLVTHDFLRSAAGVERITGGDST